MNLARPTHVWTSCDRSILRAAELRCHIIARGALGTVAIWTEAGQVIVTSTACLRRIRKEEIVPPITGPQVDRLAQLSAAYAYIEDEEDLLFFGFVRAAIPWADRLDQLTQEQAAALIACLERALRPQTINESATAIERSDP